MDCPTNWICLVVSHSQIQGGHLGQAYGMDGAMSSGHPVRRLVMLTWSIAGDVNTDHVRKLVSANLDSKRGRLGYLIL